MVRNGRYLLSGNKPGRCGPPDSHAPIKNMLNNKVKEHGVSHGLAEVGYDIRLKQDVCFLPTHQYPNFSGPMIRITSHEYQNTRIYSGRFCITSAIEEFDMPNDLLGIVHDKSTWARKGLSVFNTVIEPGFKGGLTLELVYHGQDELHIPAGSGIAQVIFHEIAVPAQYYGKYQNQSSDPEPARFD